MDEYRKLAGKSVFQLRNRLPEQPRKTSELRKEISSTVELGLEKSAENVDDLDGDLEFEDLAVSSRGTGDGTQAEGMNEDILVKCTGKDKDGNVKRRARFGRRWTHNEQLVVSSCGVIIARATFFGSEAPNGVKVCSFSYAA